MPSPSPGLIAAANRINQGQIFRKSSADEPERITPPRPATALPENYKTVLCTHWLEKRSCPFDSKCKYAHGEDELRPKI